MRAATLAFVVGVALAVASARATPLAPMPALIEPGATPSVELVRERLWTRLAPNPLARPMGLLALGQMRAGHNSSLRRLGRPVVLSSLLLVRGSPAWFEDGGLGASCCASGVAGAAATLLSALSEK
jgi:hypothetical protein